MTSVWALSRIGVALGAAIASASLSIESCAWAQGSISADPSPANAVDFDEAIDRIIGRSTGIATQESNLGATRARNLPVRLRFLPTLSLDARRTYSGGTNQVNTRQDQVEGVAGLNLFRFGADLSSWRAATDDELSQEAVLQDQVIKTESLAVGALVRFVQGQREIEVYSRIVELQTQILKIAHARYDHGLLPLQEIDRVSIDRDNAVARLADARSGFSTARSQLVALLGETPVRKDWSWKNRLVSFTPPLLEDVDRLLGRPDVRAAASRLAAEEQRHSRDSRLILPSLDTDLTYGRYGTGPFESLKTQWTAGVGVTIPLFDQLTRYSAAQAQSYVRAGAEQSLEQTRRDALADWTSARQGFEIALESAVNRDRTLGTSGRIFDENLKRFQAGRINANDLALDQNRLYEAELLAVQGWATAHLQFARVCHSMGKRVRDCR